MSAPSPSPSPATDSPRRPPPRGVGLIGILSSLTVVAIMAGLVIPAFFSRHDITLDNASTLLARDLRSAQNRAAHLGQRTRLRFDRNGWQALDERDAPLTRFASSERIERRLDADAVFEGVTLEAIEFGPGDEIVFDSTGRPDRSGSLEVHFRGQSRRLSLEQQDGRVVIEGLTRPWKDEGL